MSEVIRRQVDIQVVTLQFTQSTASAELAEFRASFKEAARDNEWQLEDVQVFGYAKEETGGMVLALATMAKYEYVTLEEYRARNQKAKPEVVEPKAAPKVGEKK